MHAQVPSVEMISELADAATRTAWKPSEKVRRRQSELREQAADWGRRTDEPEELAGEESRRLGAEQVC